MAERERANERVAAAALRVSGVVETHNITVLEGPEGRSVTLHARLAEELTLDRAAPIVERLKQEIRSEIGIARVYVHVEPFAPDAQPAVEVSDAEAEVASRAAAAVRSVTGGEPDVMVYRQSGRLLVLTAVRGRSDMTVRQAHSLASRIEDAVRESLDDVDDVIVEVV
jgi:divalent metal cation (Fe/Co/Zn/Cd) transporter